MSTRTSSREATVRGVAGNIVSIHSEAGALVKNEVGYVHVGEERLMAETLRVNGRSADMQVFENTDGVRVGDRVELTGRMLSVTLAPGLLGTVFDGLQNPLHALAEQDGFFLKRGHAVPPVDTQKTWDFTPTVAVGDRLVAGDTLGTVPEKHFEHRVMVPFDEPGEVEVVEVRGGRWTVRDVVAVVRDARGRETELTMQQEWPVRRPLTARMLRRRVVEREFPREPMVTTIRLVDTFFPIALGGTACIPGPFGAGKTVLQGLIARYSSVDVVIVIACGERAGEVLETIETFTDMPDPATGGQLIDRTIIVCNTSSMPVAAREASIFTGVTLGEYYRQMGLDVLLIADSTSRWAQAMRETSARLEEIPGEEAYPAYLDSAIKGVYERAGLLRLRDGSHGSVTMVGTVSPAGGNFEEPVTQATLGTVKTFLGLSYDRAYKRFYPAIDPLISWSRYLEQLAEYFDANYEPDWTARVHRVHELLRRGASIQQMMQVTGEEGVTLDDFVTQQKATLVDMVFLQQDAFDPVDVSMSVERQRESFGLLRELLDHRYHFADKAAVRDYFTRLTSLYKNLNYAERDSAEYEQYLARIRALQDEFT